jgi:O-antigen/teichoic acid export membrane protein
MNTFGKSVIKKLGYSFGANIISLLVSVLTVSFLPKYMTLADYGLYQLFLFYFGYVGFLHFGVLGGGIIRYAGCTYFDLDYATLKSECVILLGILIVLSGILWGANTVLAIFTDSTVIVLFLVSMFMQHFIWYSISMLQMSNRIEDASRLLFGERISWGILSIGAIILGYAHAVDIIFVFAATRILVMCYSFLFVPEIVKAPVHFTTHVWNEFIINFKVGFPITLSDICSLLVIGIIRFAISDVWDITVFAKTSLVLSITFFFLTFITTASTVLLPALKQLEDAVSDALYIPLNNLTSFLFLGSLLLFYPMKVAIAAWLPQYADSLIFMGMLFPILFFESKFNLLVITYLKKKLKTQYIFYVNAFSTLLSLFGCLLFCYYFSNLKLTIFLITFILGVRYSLGALVLGHHLSIETDILHDYFLSMCMIIIFEMGVLTMSIVMGAMLYIGCLGIYSICSYKNLKTSWKNIKIVMTEP